MKRKRFVFCLEKNDLFELNRVTINIYMGSYIGFG